MSKKELLCNSTSSGTNTDVDDGPRTRTWSSSTQQTNTLTGDDAPTFKAPAPTTLEEHRRSSYVGRDSAPPTATAANLSRREAEQKIATIRQHYYPEGEWGWVVMVCCFTVNAITYGLQLNYASAMHKYIVQRHGRDKYFLAFYPGAISLALSTFMSPIIVATCRKKSPRVTAIMGGLISTLGCLFTSFTTQFHQIFVSWCFVVGIGLGIVREAANIMVGSYFKRRRESVELVCLMGTGLGVALFNHFLQYVLSKLNWRFGLQATTGLLSSLFIIGMLYRPASLYHPQRRAIVHLKSQRRKIKEKNPTTQKAPFFEFSTLRTKTVKVLMAVCFMASFAIHTPFLFIVPLADSEDSGAGVVDSYLLQTIVGLAHAFGSCLFGMLVVGNSDDCYVGRRYLSQAGLLGLSFSCASPLALGGFRGLSLLAVLCGALSGGLCYSLKLLVFERLRARHFSRAWGFVHWAMSLPIVLIVLITQFISGSSAVGPAGPGIILPGVTLWDFRAAFYVSSGCALLACLLLFALPVSHRAACRIVYADPFQRNGSLSSSWHTCSLSGSSIRNNSSASRRNASQNVNVGGAAVGAGLGGGVQGTLGGSASGNGSARFRERPHTPIGVSLSSGPVASGSGLNGSSEVRAEECVSCRQRLDRLQRTVSWATSVDLLNAQISNFEDNDDFNEIGKRPELLTCISEEGLVEMVDPTILLSDCCEYEPYDEDLSPSPESPVKDKRPQGSFGHLHQWQPAMTPIEEVTSTV